MGLAIVMGLAGCFATIISFFFIKLLLANEREKLRNNSDDW